jgi:predicted nucleotide-binding protein with TIR-like domain
MARKSAQPPTPEQPLYLALPREEAAAKVTERMQRGEELKARPITSFEAHSQVQRDYWTWSEYNEELLRRMFTSPKVAEEYSASIGIFAVGGPPRLDQEIKELHDDIDMKIRRLASIRDRLELIPIAPGVGPIVPAVGVGPSAIREPAGGDNRNIFIVHGHDEGLRESVARLLHLLELTPIILHEQVSQGRTIVEKLEHHGDVGYAIVVLTPDDVGGTSEQALMPRARQNVVLELGYFMGRLGRDRVCAVHRGAIELPSDYMGVVYIPFDSGGAWRFALAKELRAAGFSVDMNKL